MKKWILWNVAEAWKRTYFRDGRWENGAPLFYAGRQMKGTGHSDRGAIYESIVAANGDLEKIEAAIGNKSWTTFTCVECDTEKMEGVTFDNGDGGVVTICAGCIRKALAL
jgi:hypothetical protein